MAEKSRGGSVKVFTCRFTANTKLDCRVNSSQTPDYASCTLSGIGAFPSNYIQVTIRSGISIAEQLF